MITYLKRTFKRLFRALGLEITSYIPARSATAQIAASLRHFNVDLVLDVGANFGQFAEDIRSGGYAGKIVSFEPLTDAHAKLKTASSRDKNWIVYRRCAIGATDGEVTINIAANSASSSLLPMLESHIKAAPDTAYIGKETVPLLALDSVSSSYLREHKNVFIKIDTQGFEWEVLNGAAATLPHVKGVLVEMSMIPLYEGQHLWEEVLLRLKGAGFGLWAVQPGFIDPVSGRTLQFDGIFFKEN